jgi:hypothetical protein
MTNSDDVAIEVLLSLLGKEKAEVSEALVRQCFEIQKAFQYDKDREVPLDRMRRLVEAEVARIFAIRSGLGGATT